MNISAFSGDTFDPKDWINETFRSTEVAPNKEVYVTSVINKLQLYVQQVSGAMEETSEQVLKSMPKVIHDAESVQKEALMLREKMHLVKEDIVKIQKDTALSLAVLEKLDKIKCQLQTAKQALHEADNWTVLANDIENVIESRNIEAIAAKVISMQQSLLVLSNSPDFDERKIQLEGFKNTLEAIASTQIVKAFTKKSIDESKKFVNIFQSMEKLPQLIKYYANCEKETMLLEWSKLVELDQDARPVELLTFLYQNLTSSWHKQVTWCQQVFDSIDMLPSIYTDVLLALHKEIISMIDRAVKEQQDQIELLITLKNASDRFAINFYNAFSQAGESVKNSWPDLEKAIYVIYVPFTSIYTELEKRQITNELSNLNLEANIDLLEMAQSLGQATPHVIAACSRALSRCEKFSEMALVPSLVSAVQYCLLKHLGKYKDVLHQIDAEKNNKEEWAMFKICLLFLQNIGDLQSWVDEYEKELTQKLLTSEKAAKKDYHPDIKNLIINNLLLNQYENILVLLKEGNEVTILKEVKEQVIKVSNRGYQATLDVMFSQVAIQLEKAISAWTSNPGASQQLPDYSFAPLEYITQIGEYLMTLPQHLEPFLAREGGESRADVILSNIAEKTCSLYKDLILSLKDVSSNTAKQIAIDIGYLGNVLEDLGFCLSESLSQMTILLKLTPEQYQTQSTGCSPKLVAAVRQMRNITSL